MEKNVFAVVCGIEVVNAKSAGAVASILDGSTVGLLGAYASILGVAPSFEVWEAARISWREGYASQRETVPTVSAMDKAWSRFASALKDAHGLEKPKASTAEAQKKAESRAEAAKAAPTFESVEAAKAAVKAASEAVQAAATADNIAKAAATIKAAEKFEKAAEKAAEKAESDRLKGRRSALIETIKAGDGAVIAVFEAALILASESAPDEHKLSAWSVLSGLAPVPKSGADSEPVTRTRTRRAA